MKHILLASIAAAALLSGCASILDRIGEDDIAKLDALADKWIAKLEAKLAEPSEPDKPAPETPAPETPADPAPSVDQADFSALKWQYGGFNGAGARLDSPRLSNLRSTGSRLYYKWDVGLAGWGLGHGDAGALCCVFFEQGGKWTGGKFDWVSTSRTDRELKHVEYYSNWGSSGIQLPWRGRVAFVVVSADGRRRSNVLVAEGPK